MKHFTAIISILAIFCGTIKAQNSYFTAGLNGTSEWLSMPKYEVRAVWLTTLNSLDWPTTKARDNRSREQQQELCHILDRLKQAGINTVLLQTRIRATLIYPSRWEPFDACLTGRTGSSPRYDALAFAVEECHRRGMEIHAWVVTLPAGKWTSEGCRQLRNRMPKVVKKVGDVGYLDPSQEATATYLSDICAEITSNYDIDGIHLDYIRYPEDWPWRYSKEQGRTNITHIATTISHRVKQIKPWVKMSCSPIGKYDDLPRQSSHGWNARSRVCQDAQSWLALGIMDQLYPMIYFRYNNFYPFIFDWQQCSFGRTIAAGLAAYSLASQEGDWPLTDIADQMATCRTLGVGYCLFRSSFFTNNTKGIYSFTANNFNLTPSLIPPMTWSSKSRPETPQELTFSTLGDTLFISWRHNASQLGYNGSECSYVLYASESYPVDTNNPNNIIGAYLHEKRVALPHPSNLYYAVTAVDRFGIESDACQEQLSQGIIAEQSPYPSQTIAEQLFSNIQKVLTLTDATLLIVKNLSGQTVYCINVAAVKRQKNIIRFISSRLSAGSYKLYSSTKKNKQHFLGTFVVLK